jgi:hypothetical protein
MNAKAKPRPADRNDLKVTENVCVLHEALGALGWASVNELASRHPEMSLGTVKNVVGALTRSGLVSCNTACHPWQYRLNPSSGHDLVTMATARRIADAAAVFREKRAARAAA